MADISKLEGLVIQPNFIKLKGGRGPISNFIKGLFWDYYMYIDTEPFEIDELLVNDLVLVNLYDFAWGKQDVPYCLCMMRARHRYKNILTNKIFPLLHNKMYLLFGEEYEKFCCDFVNDIVENYEGDIYEIFSRPASC